MIGKPGGQQGFPDSHIFPLTAEFTPSSSAGRHTVTIYQLIGLLGKQET